MTQAAWLGQKLFLAVLLLCAVPAQAASDRIQLVASPPAFAFARELAKGFAKPNSFDEPRVEALQSAVSVFCKSVALGSPDAVLTLDPLSDADKRLCKQAGVTPVEVILGSAGLVVLRPAEAPALELKRSDLFLAIAAAVPNPDGSLVANSNVSWSAIDPRLPNQPIEVVGPAPGSPAAHAVNDLILERGARNFPALSALETKDEVSLARLVGGVRAPPAYRSGTADAGVKAIWIADFSALHTPGYAAVGIDGVLPQETAIAQGRYPLSRPLRLVIKREHIGLVPGLGELLAEALGDAALGDKGYLASTGLVPGPQSAYGVTAGAILSRTR